MKPLGISKRNSAFQVLQALKTNRAKRNELGEVFVEGIAAIKSAVKAGTEIRTLIVADRAPLSGWARELVARNPGARLVEMSRDLYDELCDRSEPSEILATFAMPRHGPAEARSGGAPFVVVVDRPGNHGNLGSLIRSADAFGVDRLVTLGHAVDLWDPTVIRASLGAIFSVPVRHEPSTRALGAWIVALRAAHPALKIVGTDSKASARLADAAEAARPVVLLVGNEAKGLSVELQRMTDTMVRIPMVGSVDSLNVACAASIVLHEIAGRPARAADPRAELSRDPRQP